MALKALLDGGLETENKGLFFSLLLFFCFVFFIPTRKKIKSSKSGEEKTQWGFT